MDTTVTPTVTPTVVRRRPTPVTILAVIGAISATVYLLFFLSVLGAEFVVLAGLAERGFVVIDEATLDGLAFSVILLVMAVIGYAAAFLMFRMRQVGWTLTILLAGWSLASQIYLYATDGTLVPGPMLINVVSVLYLNQRQVRAAFGIGAPSTSMPDLDERA